MSINLAELSAAKDEMTRLTMAVYFHDQRMKVGYERLQKEQESMQTLSDQAGDIATQLMAATATYVELSSKTTKA